MFINILFNGINFALTESNGIVAGADENILPSLQALYDAGQYQVLPDPEPMPLPVRFIDMRRLRLALLQLELLDDIDAAILQQSRSAQIEWEFATDVRADHPLVVQLATAMSLDIDEIFDLAESFT